MYNLVAENTESTVVADYVSPYERESAYQTEDALERAFVAQLEDQAYERLHIRTNEDLVANLRRQLEQLNAFHFSDAEWQRFFLARISNPNLGIEQKTAVVQEDHVQLLIRDDGTTKNISLLDKDSIHNNRLQVLNQYETEQGQRANRYDVTVLVNGLPMVHIELKRRGVDIREAFNQINRYQRESFWSGSGLFEYVQLFVISNGTFTKYYSNTTRNTHVREQAQKEKKGKRSSNSFEFTSWWADETNRPITDLKDFARTFFARHTLLNILTRYCVFTSDRMLLVMRPYQIVATERILGKINIGYNSRKLGTLSACGFVWHTTGSGKTLTSFKTAQLASRLPYVQKVLFVVDRKDLDYQTMKEYDKFEKGAANSNSSTAILKKQLADPAAHIIITTLQKLAILITQERQLPAYAQPTVLIFDECHRSQFGRMHGAITKAFKQHYLFGFTGTPILGPNAAGGANPRTTLQTFGDKLHTYTIVNAINDQNVLPFRIDYISTMKAAENIEDTAVRDIDRERALAAPERLQQVVSYVLKHFNQKTQRNSKPYEFTALSNIKEVAADQRRRVEEVRQRIRLSGFNSLFAVSSIEFAKAYYLEFRRQQAALPAISRLKVATIFSFAVNDEGDGMDEENAENTGGLSANDRDFLDGAIADYNQLFGTSYDTSAERFQNYYKDVSLRMKNRELDLLIVVNMFLTGFDATTLNTLWVDKNLRHHGLLQAFSRTNRILNSVKTFGNIVCFRNLEEATNEAIALFSNKEAGGIVLLRTFREYFDGYVHEGKVNPGYRALVEELLATYPAGQLIVGEAAKKAFVKLYGAILRLRNVLAAFDEFENEDLLTGRHLQDYHGLYISLYQEFRRNTDGDKVNVNEDLVFEMELIKQVEVNIDYILALIQQYQQSHQRNRELLLTIDRAVGSSVELRNKKDLIDQFMRQLTPGDAAAEVWSAFVQEQRQAELEALIAEEKLDADATEQFMHHAFRDGYVPTTGTGLAQLLPPVSRFTPDGMRTQLRQRVADRLKAFFDRYWSISEPEG